ncbi:MAG: flagellar basal-body rod protein FlgF [Clostridiales bacterium]|nr:flagellar basal-body rod protein FlgF [Clostridiales bacterium]
MTRGLYTAATGMIHQARRLDVVANNISNIYTNGYKRDQVVSRTFNEELLLRLEKGQISLGRHIGTVNHGVNVDTIFTSYRQGTLQQTGKNTHLALNGPGFFTVITDDDMRYTRDGGFMLDSSGYLVTEDGWPVAGEMGPVYIGTESFVVDPLGYIFVDGEYIDRLQIVDFENPQALRKVGHNLFINSDPENQVLEFEGEVIQGFLEGSNVDAVREVTEMMMAIRNYEANAQVIRMIDESLAKTVNDIGRV